MRLYGYVCHSMQCGSALGRRYLGKRASRQANEAKQASLPREIGMSPVRSNPVPLLTFPPLLPPCGSVPIVAAASDFLSPPPLRSFSVHLMLYSYFVRSQHARYNNKKANNKKEKNNQRMTKGIALVMDLIYLQRSFSQFSSYLALRNLHVCSRLEFMRDFISKYIKIIVQ